MHIVIIGGVAAGASAATKARRVNEKATITLLERGPHISFANCGLPYYINGLIPTKEKLLVQTPQSLSARYNLDIRVLHEAVAVDRAAREVTVRDIEKNVTYALAYDKLVLAPGAAAIFPPIEGLKSFNIFQLRTIPDTVAIRELIEREKPSRAVVLGGGYIGLEAVEVLHSVGMKVAVVEKAPQILTPLDADMAAYVHEHLAAKGVEVVVADGVKRIVQNGEGRGVAIVLESGREIPFDIAVAALGVRPDVTLAKQAGLELGTTGAISVSRWMQTSDPHIYAAGDAVESTHLVTGKPAWIPLARAANLQGRTAGANAAGGKATFKGVMGTAIVGCLGMAAARTGLTEREALAAGIPCFTSVTHAGSHAGYYPGAKMLHIKLVVEKETGRLLGGQVVGEDGADKRIDVLATALHAGFTVSDIADLDLAYAPQFGAAKDPVVVAGIVAENRLKGIDETVDLQTVKKKQDAVNLVDVREARECSLGALDCAAEVPLGKLRERLGDLDPGKETVVYCQSGLRSYLASCILKGSGFRDVKNLDGGYLHCSQQQCYESHSPATR